jgi:hypothetical protein
MKLLLVVLWLLARVGAGALWPEIDRRTTRNALRK